MRFRAFLSILAPYLAGLSLFFFVSLFLIERATQEQSKIIAHQEYVRISQDISKIIEKNDDYEEHIKNYIERYKVGQITYAWLIDSKGNELAFSQNKRFMSPDILMDDKEKVLPYIKDNRPSGITIFKSVRNKKIVEYGPITGSSLILVLVFLVPNDNLVLFSGYTIQFVLGVFFLILILAGYLWSIYSSKLFSGPLEKLTYMIFKVSIEEPFDKKDIPKDPECIPAITFLNRISNSLKERKVSDLNPLTNLPGNLSLQEQLFASIDMKEQFSVAALDIARFSAYNHKYGFTRGDGVIRFLNSTIQSVLQEKGDKGDFVCHLGADHFVFITRSSAVDVICSAIIKTFTEHIPLFYEEEDRKRGYILSKNRQGEINKFSFMTIIIGVATNAKRPLIHPLQISHITNEIIEFLKKQEKSNYLIDRRASDREPAEYTPEDEREPAAETTSAEAEPLAQPVTEADTASIEAQSEPVPAGQGTDEVTVKSSESE